MNTEFENAGTQHCASLARAILIFANCPEGRKTLRITLSPPTSAVDILETDQTHTVVGCFTKTSLFGLFGHIGNSVRENAPTHRIGICRICCPFLARSKTPSWPDGKEAMLRLCPGYRIHQYHPRESWSLLQHRIEIHTFLQWYRIIKYCELCKLCSKLHWCSLSCM